MTTRSAVKILKGAIVCEQAELIGPITIGPRTIIHPTVRIVAEAGPIYIGEGNLIEDRCHIINARPPGVSDTAAMNDVVMIIGNYNVFEVDSVCEAPAVGDNNVFECGSFIGRETSVTNGCIIGTRCRVTSRETLPENTVCYGDKGQRRVAYERPPAQILQLDFLAKLLPNFHHIRKCTRFPPAASSTASAASDY